MSSCVSCDGPRVGGDWWRPGARGGRLVQWWWWLAGGGHTVTRPGARGAGGGAPGGPPGPIANRSRIYFIYETAGTHVSSPAHQYSIVFVDALAADAQAADAQRRRRHLSCERSSGGSGRRGSVAKTWIANPPPRRCATRTTLSGQRLPPGWPPRFRMGGGSSLGWLWVHSPLLSAHPEAPAGAAASRRHGSNPAAESGC